MKKTTVFIAILSTFFVGLLIFTYASEIQNDLARQVLRLHIVANSDTDYDQQLKYAVRDRIITETHKLFKDSQSIEETQQIALANIDFLQSIAQSEIEQQGFNYIVTVSLGNHPFPATVYGNILFPAGRYDALKIVIEEGSGENWWCVLFPPLCFIDGINMEFADADAIQVRFRIADLFRGN